MEKACKLLTGMDENNFIVLLDAIYFCITLCTKT